MQLWLALGEISRLRPDVGEYVACARAYERNLLASLGLGLSGRDVDLVLATAEGVRLKICDPVCSLVPREAVATLGRLLTALGAPAAEAA